MVRRLSGYSSSSRVMTLPPAFFVSSRIICARSSEMVDTVFISCAVKNGYGVRSL